MLPASTASQTVPRRPRAAYAGRDSAWSAPANVSLHGRADRAWFTRRLVLIALSLFGLGLAHVWLAARAREVDYDRVAALRIVRRLEREARDLEAKVESLNRHDRIERIAREQLGMVRPVSGQKRELP